jgi:hypothetical protein
MKTALVSLLISAACLAAPLSAARADDAPDALIEFPDESRALIRATQAFFDQIEATSDRQKQPAIIGVPLSITRSSARVDPDTKDLMTRMGPVGHLTGYRITWYPVETLYGTVDFMGTWNGNRNLVCGYLTWDLSDPDAPELETVSASFVDIAALATASDSDIHEILLEANCAHGAIEANYRMFDVTG